MNYADVSAECERIRSRSRTLISFPFDIEIAKAVEAEREACAQLLEEMDAASEEDHGGILKLVAAKIRARGK